MEIEIDAPRGQVFGHLAQPELMKRWVGGLLELRDDLARLKQLLEMR